jgi:hypothetical protein
MANHVFVAGSREDLKKPLFLDEKELAVDARAKGVAYWRLDGGWCAAPAKGEAADLRDFAWLATALTLAPSASGEPRFDLFALARRKAHGLLGGHGNRSGTGLWADLRAVFYALFSLVVWLVPFFPAAGAGRQSLVRLALIPALVDAPSAPVRDDWVSRFFLHAMPTLSLVERRDLGGGLLLMLGFGVLFFALYFGEEALRATIRHVRSFFGALRHQKRAARLLRGLLAHGGALPDDFSLAAKPPRAQCFVGETPFFFDRTLRELLPEECALAYACAVWGRGDESRWRVSGGGRYRLEVFLFNAANFRRLAFRRFLVAARSRVFSAFRLVFSGAKSAGLAARRFALFFHRREAFAAARLMRERDLGRPLSAEQTRAAARWVEKALSARERSMGRYIRLSAVWRACLVFSAPPSEPNGLGVWAQLLRALNLLRCKFFIPLLMGLAAILFSLAVALRLAQPLLSRMGETPAFCLLGALCLATFSSGILLMTLMLIEDARSEPRWVALLLARLLRPVIYRQNQRLASQVNRPLRHARWEAIRIAAAMLSPVGGDVAAAALEASGAASPSERDGGLRAALPRVADAQPDNGGGQASCALSFGARRSPRRI